MQLSIFACILILIVKVCNAWWWDHSQIEQTGVLNTIVAKTDLTPTEALTLKADTVVQLLSHLNALISAVLSLLAAICVIAIYGVLKQYLVSKIEKRVLKAQNNNNTQ